MKVIHKILTTFLGTGVSLAVVFAALVLCTLDLYITFWSFLSILGKQMKREENQRTKGGKAKGKMM